MSSSAAFKYGVRLGLIKRQMQEFAQAVVAGFEHGLRPVPAVDDPVAERERRSVRAYERRVAAERETGLRFVQAEADRVRRALGLPRQGGGRS